MASNLTRWLRPQSNNWAGIKELFTRTICNRMYVNNHGERGEHGEKKVKGHSSTWPIPVIPVTPVVVLSVRTLKSGLTRRNYVDASSTASVHLRNRHSEGPPCG